MTNTETDNWGNVQQCGSFAVSLNNASTQLAELKLDDGEDSYMIADLDPESARELARKLIAFADNADREF